MAAPTRRVFKHNDRVIYEWDQSLEELNVYITPPPGLTANLIECEITANHVTLGLRGSKDKFLNHDLSSSVVVAESYWMLDGGELTINLQKMKKGLTWPSVFVGHGELNPLEAENTKQQLMLERFQEENPGFDFSQAEFNGSAPDPPIQTSKDGTVFQRQGDCSTDLWVFGSTRCNHLLPDGFRVCDYLKTERMEKASTSISNAASGSASRAARQVRSGGDMGQSANAAGSTSGTGSSAIAASKQAARGAFTTITAAASSSSSSVIKFKTTFRNTIYDTMLRRGWKETTENDWDFYWADREYIYELLDTVHLENNQRVNHYRNGRELCRKDHLIKNLKRAKRQMDKKIKAGEEPTLLEQELGAYDFFPVTYILPAEYSIFVEEFKRNQGVWIMKPTSKAQGKGIFLFTKLGQISDWRTDFRWQPQNQQVETYVAQRYLSNPYLVGGKKFDLRLYALVPTFSPLEIYLYRGGFARFTNSRYSNNPSDIANSFIHLTNVAIQKTSENYSKVHGGKWDLRNLKLHMLAKHGLQRTNKLFFEIQAVIIKSLVCVEKIMLNDKHCFQLFGYDIMIDENLKPWLIEVNASPSISANTSSDYQLKCGMLNDMLDIIDLENTGKAVGEDRVGGFDLVFKDGMVRKPDHCQYTSFLGADIKKTTRVATQ